MRRDKPCALCGGYPMCCVGCDAADIEARSVGRPIQSPKATRAQSTTMLPETVTVNVLTDMMRLAVIKELWAKHHQLGNIHMDQTLYTYEREAKERLGT